MGAKHVQCDGSSCVAMLFRFRFKKKSLLVVVLYNDNKNKFHLFSAFQVLKDTYHERMTIKNLKTQQK